MRESELGVEWGPGHVRTAPICGVICMARCQRRMQAAYHPHAAVNKAASLPVPIKPPLRPPSAGRLLVQTAPELIFLSHQSIHSSRLSYCLKRQCRSGAYREEGTLDVGGFTRLCLLTDPIFLFVRLWLAPPCLHRNVYRYRKEGRFGVIVVIFAVVGGGGAGVAITEGL